MTAAPPVGLYVHVPFCVSVCPYCDFVVVAGAAARGPRNRLAEYAIALRRELELRADALDQRWGRDRPTLRSVYLGGGTPSLLPAEEVASLLACVRDRFGLAGDGEVTLEANPGPDERGDPAAWRDAGVTRLSFGAQSLDPPTLRRLGRRHAPEDVADAVAGARAAGITSVNVDLLIDPPGARLETVTASLDGVVALAPDHLSVYVLSLDDPVADGLTGVGGDHLPMTAGARRWRERARPEQDEDRAAAAYHHATAALAAAGYRGYEIANWARPGHQSRHNLAYWRRQPVEAVGPGAHAFDGEVRRWTAARLDGYLVALAAGTLPPGGSEPALTPAEAAAEALVLGLRLDDGVPAAAGDEPPLAAHLDWALAAGLLQRTGDRLVLTTTGRLLSNELFARLV